MKVLQVFNVYVEHGGEANSVERIARHLELGGHDVIRHRKESSSWLGSNAPTRWKQPFLLYSNKTALDEIRKIHVREKPDVWLLHNVVPVVSLGIYRIAGELGVPVVQWLHNYRPISPGGALRAFSKDLAVEDRFRTWKEVLSGSWRGRLMTLWLVCCYRYLHRQRQFESVKAWVAVSERMKEIFRQAGWFTDRLYSCPHSWDISETSISPVDKGYFLYIGRIVEEKGIRFILNLWAQPDFRNLELVVAGSGDLEEELRAMMLPNVKFTGFVGGEEKHRLLRECRAVLFPSLWNEPLSTVAYEAYDMEKPVICSDRGGMSEIVVDGITGRLLAPADSQAWKEAISELALDEELARKLGLQSKAWLRENVSWKTWVSNFEMIVSRMASVDG